MRAGGARCFAQERGGGLALQLEEAVGARDFGIGEVGERVQGSGDGDGAEQLLTLGLGFEQLPDDALGVVGADDFEDFGDREIQFAADLLDGAAFDEVVVEDVVGMSRKL